MKSYLEKRSNIYMRVDKSGGCAPATDFEIELWKERKGLIRSICKYLRDFGPSSCSEWDGEDAAEMIEEAFKS